MSVRSIFWWVEPSPVEIAAKQLAETWGPLFEAERALEAARHNRDMLRERIDRLRLQLVEQGDIV